MYENPAIHQIMSNLSSVTRYSISALVRFLIEWECLDGGFMFEDGIDRGSGGTSGIVITEVIEIRINHKYHIINEIVEEHFIWEFG